MSNPTKQTAVDRVRAGEDSDAVYDELQGPSEQPAAFSIRFATNTMTEAEKAAVGECGALWEAFALAYPDYVSRQEFRDSVAAAGPQEIDSE